MTAAEIFLFLYFPSLMAFAAASDLTTMTIPNRVSVLLLAGFAVMAPLTGMSLPAFGMHLLGGLVIFGICFTFFAMGWMGGGDAKLATATAVWVGWTHIFEYALVAAVLGGLMTVFILSARGMPFPMLLARFGWLERHHRPETGIPYGIALAAAGLLIYPQIAIWKSVIAA